MRYMTFDGGVSHTYPIAILVADLTDHRKSEILREYVTPFGLNQNSLIVIQVHRRGKKTPAKEMQAWVQEELVPELKHLGVEYLIVGDGDYFKILTKAAKVDPLLGYVLNTSESGFGEWPCVYVPNYRTVFYDEPKIQAKIAQGINALKAWVEGTYVAPGVDIIKFAAYPKTVEDIVDWLEKLLEMDCPLAIDIEGFSLKHYSAGIGTIAFAWSQHEGIAFPVDLLDNEEDRRLVREALLNFFIRFQNKAVYHRITYDVYVLIYQLFMEHILDNEGLLRGMEIMLRNWDCTVLVSYLATNTCAGNKLGLKGLAQEFAGNYAVEEIKDIRKIPLPQLLQYNLIDTLSTIYVHTKYWNKLVEDQQLEIYETLFKPATLDIIQMQLTGMPIDIEQVHRVADALNAIQEDAVDRIQSSPLVQHYRDTLMAAEWVADRNSKLKVKRVTAADFKGKFNPGSGDDLRGLLYEMLGMDVIDLTDTKLPATGKKTLEKLKNRTEDPAIKSLLEALIEFVAVAKLNSSFIPTLQAAVQDPNGWHWVHGYFNLGGTKSGRLSSSDPNLQNLPANVEVMLIKKAYLEAIWGTIEPFMKKDKLSLGKLIKSCFKAPPGWFFGGIDANALEDRISALTSKDPNKLKVYTDGYDGHCLRAHAYFGDQMPDIDPTTVAGINEIDVKYKELRQKGKNPTFALTYEGNFKTLMRNYGFTEELARKCEASYQTLYQVSINYVKTKVDRAMKDGYVTVAFGLRLRTPMLHRTVRGTSKTPYEAEAEGRTAGNALGQSWCMLNSRAWVEFMGKVRASEFRHMIRPCGQIHDAGYALIQDNIDAVHFANTHLAIAYAWQDHPDIWHDEVKLSGELGIFYPDWSQECVLPNGATPTEIITAFETHVLGLSK